MGDEVEVGKLESAILQQKCEDVAKRIGRRKRAGSAEHEPQGEYTMAQGDRVPGYQRQSEGQLENIVYVKRQEERILRYMDTLAQSDAVDQRWLALSRTHLQTAAMFLIRAVAQPTRIALPEDDIKEGVPSPPSHTPASGLDTGFTGTLRDSDG